MWLIYALLSALVWGANYILYEKIVQKISIPTLYFLTSAVSTLVFLSIALMTNALNQDFQTILKSKEIQLYIGINVITYIVANLFIALSIQSKNAALAGLIEISYPIFIILLAALFFKENHLNLSVLFGGALIFSGISVIYFFNK